MPNNTKIVFDVQTQEATEIPMTDTEQKNWQETVQKLEEETTKAEQARQTAVDKLAAIGLTVEDLTALGLAV